MRGRFITFEGSEGSGKSTQSRALYNYLKSRGNKVIYLREPGGTKVSEKIRKMLLDGSNHRMTASCEMLLYMASRAQVVEEVIKPALVSGSHVICDRFLDSTVAYQGFGLGMNIALIRYLGDFVSAGVKPDLTIFLDLPVEKGLRHRRRSYDRIESRPLAYHRRVRNGYLTMARREPRRFKVVRVAEDKSVTQNRIRELVIGYVF
ncbi:MAG: dTMP kinase [Candidatus Omnitrophota bacterium]